MKSYKEFIADIQESMSESWIENILEAGGVHLTRPVNKTLSKQRHKELTNILKPHGYTADDLKPDPTSDEIRRAKTLQNK